MDSLGSVGRDAGRGAVGVMGPLHKYSAHRGGDVSLLYCTSSHSVLTGCTLSGCSTAPLCSGPGRMEFPGCAVAAKRPETRRWRCIATHLVCSRDSPLNLAQYTKKKTKGPRPGDTTMSTASNPPHTDTSRRTD